MPDGRRCCKRTWAKTPTIEENTVHGLSFLAFTTFLAFRPVQVPIPFNAMKPNAILDDCAITPPIILTESPAKASSSEKPQRNQKGSRRPCHEFQELPHSAQCGQVTQALRIAFCTCDSAQAPAAKPVNGALLLEPQTSNKLKLEVGVMPESTYSFLSFLEHFLRSSAPGFWGTV